MSLKKIIKITAFLLAMFFLITAVGCNTEEAAEVPEDQLEVKTGTPMETLETFIRVYYFGEGTYDDYKKLYANESLLRTEGEFDQYRREKEPQDMFPVGYESVEDVMTHMREVEIDDANIEIHYVEDPDQEGAEGAHFFWILTKVNDQWLLN